MGTHLLTMRWVKQVEDTVLVVTDTARICLLDMRQERSRTPGLAATITQSPRAGRDGADSDS